MARASHETFHVAREYQPLIRMAGLDGAAVFSDPRIICWRKLADRENCTLDTDLPDGAKVRLHIKRYPPKPGRTPPADDEATGHHLLKAAKIQTAPLVAWGVLRDGRSFTIWLDLAGYTPGDKLVASGVPFGRLLEPTAHLAANLHRAGLHHRDLYLCHFMVKTLGNDVDVQMIDTARVRRLPTLFARRRWIVKDLAQFWYSTTRLGISDAERAAWLTSYAGVAGRDTNDRLSRTVARKVKAIARHDARLNRRQPARNVSIPQ